MEAVKDPAERAHKALMAMEDARDLMEALGEARARAVHQIYQNHGASKAARMLGISRVNLYRVIGQVPEVRQQRRAAAEELAAVAVAVMAAASTPTNENALPLTTRGDDHHAVQ